MLTLENIINLLPMSIQNKVFYFLTLHPAAIAFKKD
jgi:hypothetical protein